VMMRWVVHVARMKETGNAFIVLVGKPEEERPLETFRVEGKIILKSILRH